MSHNQNASYLDFADQQHSLSFESFYEDGKQTIELPSPAAGMCICTDLSDQGKLHISWNGTPHAEINLAPGNHKFPLAGAVPAGEGVLSLELVVGDETKSNRVYSLVSDYVFQYSEYMFRVYKDQREAQTLSRLRMQCPAPQDEQTLASLSADKYGAASGDAERLAKLLGDLHPIDLSHMFQFPASLGDTPQLRKQIDNALLNVAGQLRAAAQIVESASLNVEHARYYADQGRKN
jgi:hypothetical protein